MGKRKAGQTGQADRTPRYRQIDMRDWLVWLDAARELALPAGREYRQRLTISRRLWRAGRPPALSAGTSGSKSAHSPSRRSLG